MTSWRDATQPLHPSMLREKDTGHVSAMRTGFRSRRLAGGGARSIYLIE